MRHFEIASVALATTVQRKEIASLSLAMTVLCPSLRGAKRRSNPIEVQPPKDCFVGIGDDSPVAGDCFGIARNDSSMPVIARNGVTKQSHRAATAGGLPRSALHREVYGFARNDSPVAGDCFAIARNDSSMPVIARNGVTKQSHRAATAEGLLRWRSQ